MYLNKTKIFLDVYGVPGTLTVIITPLERPMSFHLTYLNSRPVSGRGSFTQPLSLEID